MDILMIILLMPSVAVIFCVLIFMEGTKEKEEKEAIRKAAVLVPEIPHFSSENELKRKKKPDFSQRIIVKPKSKLEIFIEEHGKQLAALMQKDAFVLPRTTCGGLEEELKEWFNRLPDVEYCILEKDSIHVKMMG